MSISLNLNNKHSNIGIISGNIRPFTNKDITNNVLSAFGRPRPIKHYRKGMGIALLTENYNKNETIEYNNYSNRLVRSSNKANSLSCLQEQPGRNIIKNDDFDCNTCIGNKFPSIFIKAPLLNSNDNVNNKMLCCSQEYKAQQRVMPSNTNLSKKYFQSSKMYLHNRCKLFKQKEFNFIKNDDINTSNLYVPQCSSTQTINESILINFIDYFIVLLLEMNIVVEEEYQLLKNNNINDLFKLTNLLNNMNNKNDAIMLLNKILNHPNNSELLKLATSNKCNQVYYKPNNSQYSQQGAVSSSARMLRLNVNTIELNSSQLKTIRDINITNTNNSPITPFVHKFKTPKCNASNASNASKCNR